jgi:hypothetical protein
VISLWPSLPPSPSTVSYSSIFLMCLQSGGESESGGAMEEAMGDGENGPQLYDDTITSVIPVLMTLCRGNREWYRNI